MTQQPDSSETQSLHETSAFMERARRHLDASSVTPHPDAIGPYKIVKALGEGGMGAVYLAEQQKPMHRRVALKVIKLGMDTRQVIARFEAEREALAMMNHPHVAKVFDAGATEQGRPYFAMEYVEGTPITDYCDEHRLSTQRRLLLFLQVCHAVQHAHQKGIIHRDLKPSNVLVTQVDGEPAVKVIDFGIAKATQQKLTEATFITEQGLLIGTPAYMSPEQADVSASDIDTRADVYSLGVILYELLVGSLPFDPQELRRAAITEVMRIIREVDPPKPSTKFAALGDTSTTVAGMRQTTRASLAKQLRGDLDWIIMKCLEKDRGRRYETANALVMELQRYLRDEPVLAGPPSAAYRVRKFVRRNRAGVIAAAAVVLALTGGLVGTSLMFVRAARAEQEQRLQREFAEESQRLAVQARDEAETVTQFLTDMLASIRPEEQGKDVSVRQVLDKAAQTVGEQVSNKPLIEARLRDTIGTSFMGLGLYDEAETQLVESAAIHRRVLGNTDRKTLASLDGLASAMLERGTVSKSEAIFRSNVAVMRRALGDEHPETLFSLNNLAATLSDQGKLAEAESLLRAILEVKRRTQGEEHPSTLASSNNFALVLQRQGKYTDAESLYRRILAVEDRTHGGENAHTLITMTNLANTLFDQGKFAEAELLHRRVLGIRRRVLGEEHPLTLNSMNSLANSLQDQDKVEEAENLHRRTLEIQRRVLGAEHPKTLTSMNNLARAIHLQRRHPEAESLYREVVDVSRRVLGEEHPDTLEMSNNLAVVIQDQGRYAEAEGICRRTVEMQRRVLGDEHPRTLLSTSNLGDTLSDQRKYIEAETVYRQTLDIRRRILGAKHSDTLESLSKLAAVLSKQGKYVQAEEMLVDTYRELGDQSDGSPEQFGQLLEALVTLYVTWDAAEPGKGHAEKANEYRRVSRAQE